MSEEKILDSDALEEYVPILEFFRVITENKILYDLCDINPDSRSMVKLLEKMNLNEKSSASSSENVFGTLVAQNMFLPIVVKIFLDTAKEFRKLNSRSEALKYETKLYRYIFSKIIKNNYSPNFISYVGYARCKLSQIEKFLEQPEQLITRMKMYYGKIINGNTKLSLLVTEDASNGAYFGFDMAKCPTHTIEKITDERYENEEYAQNFEQILFQVIYSLELMNRLKINHNDLHVGNVLVTILPSAQDLFYKMDGKVYYIRTRFIPKIFDWDTAYCALLGDNYFLEKEHRKRPWIGNEFHEKSDLYTFLCNIYDQAFDDIEEYAPSFFKEQEEIFTLTPEQVEAISRVKPYSEDDGLYKMSMAQLEMLMGTKFEGLENITTVMFTVVDDQLQFYKGHGCRPTLISSDFPTPKEFILKYMQQFESSEEQIFGNYVYTLPTEKQIQKIFIDPIRQELGREKIVGKPRFRPQKGGKVKTID